jgi:hypothetical protein
MKQPTLKNETRPFPKLDDKALQRAGNIFALLRQIERENKLGNELSNEYAVKYGYLENVSHDFFDRVLKTLVKYGYFPAYKTRTGQKNSLTIRQERAKIIPDGVERALSYLKSTRQREYNKWLYNGGRLFPGALKRKLAMDYPKDYADKDGKPNNRCLDMVEKVKARELERLLDQKPS